MYQRSASISEVHVPERRAKNRSLEYTVCEDLSERSGASKHDLRGAVGQPAGKEADYVWVQASCRQLLRKSRF